jgi:cytochrome o ubiquinol oxidase subunit 2
MKKKKSFVFPGLSSLWATVFLAGCNNIVLLNPKGPVGEGERFVIIAAFALMLIVVIPVFILTGWFSRRYRATNTQAPYMPKWDYSARIELVIWLVPFVIVAALGYLAWSRTHQLDPYKPIDPGVEPINIEAVSLDWKWLFIYPDQQIATVNELVFPANVPLNFRITSDTVMTAFFIPQLGSQIYAMAGQKTRLHLLADEPGAYRGHNQQFSGPGYNGMHFQAIATSREEFENWTHKVQQAPERLDAARYAALKKPSRDCPVTHFSFVETGLFDRIIDTYRPLDDRLGVTAGKTAIRPDKISAAEER